MKRKWSTPSSVMECFEANEYVAVCWKIGCIGTSATGGYPEAQYGSSYWGAAEQGADAHDHSGDCQNSANNRILSDTSLQENNSAQGWLDGTIKNYIDNDGSGSITPGDLVFWTTYGSNNRTWNHCGYAEQADASHPNHS